MTNPHMSAWQSLQFQGDVISRRGESPLGLILTGVTRDRPGEKMQLAFAANAPNDIEANLSGARIDRLDARDYRIVSNSRQWIVSGVAHLHLDVGESFYAAVPPRIAPWHKRAFWRVALGVASSRIARRVLFRSR